MKIMDNQGKDFQHLKKKHGVLFEEVFIKKRFGGIQWQNIKISLYYVYIWDHVTFQYMREMRHSLG